MAALRFLLCCICVSALLNHAAAVRATRGELRGGAIKVQAQAQEWPRPDRPDDDDSPALPFRSGATLNLRSRGLGAYCDARDVTLSVHTRAASAPGADADADAGANAVTKVVIKSALVCDEKEASGADGALLVIGQDFMTDQVHEGKPFYVKSQKANKFCCLVDPAAEAAKDKGGKSGGGDWPSGGGDWPSGGGDWPSGGSSGGDWPSGGGSGGDWPSGGGKGDDWPYYPGGGDSGASPTGSNLVVSCAKIHYDKSCEWVARVGPVDGTIKLMPAATAEAEAANRRRAAAHPCFPRERDGLLICNGRHGPAGGEDQELLEVETSGYRPGGGGGDNPYGPGGGDGGDIPYGPGGGSGKDAVTEQRVSAERQGA